MGRTTIDGQLSLPLIDSCSHARPPRRSSVEAAKPAAQPAVVSSRSEAQAVAPTPGGAASTPALLTTKEAATLLHVHPRTVQRLVERGQLSAVRLGAAVRFDPLDLAWLAERLKHTGGASTAAPASAVHAGRGTSVSFADRLRSQRHEHRAASA
jgi:excisionase family DNA binding protein